MVLFNERFKSKISGAFSHIRGERGGGSPGIIHILSFKTMRTALPLSFTTCQVKLYPPPIPTGLTGQLQHARLWPPAPKAKKWWDPTDTLQNISLWWITGSGVGECVHCCSPAKLWDKSITVLRKRRWIPISWLLKCIFKNNLYDINKKETFTWNVCVVKFNHLHSPILSVSQSNH